MRRILLFIAGYEELRVHREGSAAVSDICMRRGYICREARFEGEYYYFRCTLLCARGLKRICKESGIEIEVARRVGVPALLYRYRHRYGVVAGALLFLFIVFFSGRVIWDIRVDGNSRLEDGEVIEALGECGLSIGDIKSEIDTATVENVLMIRSEDISWISINLIGTVAEVEIREREVAEEAPEYDAANIVAGEDGEIVLFENVRGNIVLNIGDRVRRGELIVSGIYESVGGPLRYTVAKGGVLARCEREIIAEIPFAYEKKVYTGRVFVEKYLVFFEKEIKFYSNCRNLYTSCDKIDTVEYADVLSQGELPVGVRTVRYLEYTYETCRRDETQAQALAEYKLSCELGTLAKDAELISKRVERYVHEDRFAIVCRVECIKDIAEVRKIEIDITP